MLPSEHTRDWVGRLLCVCCVSDGRPTRGSHLASATPLTPAGEEVEADTPLDAILDQYSEQLTVMPCGKVRCELTGHEMKPDAGTVASYLGGKARAVEILSWVREHVEGTGAAWVAVDDLNLLNSAPPSIGDMRGHVVRTEFATGLTAEAAQQCIDVLRRGA